MFSVSTDTPDMNLFTILLYSRSETTLCIERSNKDQIYLHFTLYSNNYHVSTACNGLESLLLFILTPITYLTLVH